MRLEPCDSVVLTVTATALVVNRQCILQGLVLTPAAASCTVALYDPAPLPYVLTAGVATTTGATLRVVMAGAAAGGSVCLPSSGSGAMFLNGCIAIVTGTGAQAVVITGSI